MLTPLREPGGRVVFVNRGYIPAELKDRSKRAAGEIAGSRVGPIDAVVRVGVDVGVAGLHLGHQVGQRVARQRADQVRRGDGPFG